MLRCAGQVFATIILQIHAPDSRHHSAPAQAEAATGSMQFCRNRQPASNISVGGGCKRQMQAYADERCVAKEDYSSVNKPSMLLDEAAEKAVSEHYARIWTSLKLRFTAKYFSEGALLSNSASHPRAHQDMSPVPAARFDVRPTACMAFTHAIAALV